MTQLRNTIRTLALLLSASLVFYGLAVGSQPQESLEPPSDAIWLLCLALTFPLLLLYSFLTVGGNPEAKRPTLDARFQHNVQQLGGFLLVGFALLSLHLLREQVVSAAAIKGATVTTETGAVIQDPRKVPELLRVRRGRIYAGDKIIAASEVISPQQYVHRLYPEPDISYLAGYYNPTIYGNAGLEASFDRWLSGGVGLDPLLEQQRRLLNRPVVGNDLYLTVDPAMQELAHLALNGRNGAVVLLDAQSGAILALASEPHIDPANLSFNPYAGSWAVENKRIIDYYDSILAESDRPLVLRATQGLYPPGSTFKTVSAAAAIDTGTAQPTSVYTDADGTIKVEPGNYLHRDCPTCRPRNHAPTFTLTEGYKWSLNVVFAAVGVQLGANRIEEYAQRFGFGTRFEIGIPVETSRVANDPTDLDSPNDIAAIAYGQGSAQATPLQMALVAAAVANGGEVPTPFLALSVVDPETGRALWRFEPRPVKRALSVTSNERLKSMMIESVATGYAKPVAISGATIGAKTGTAETGAEDGGAHSWFIGFAGENKDRPQYAIAVIIENGGEGTKVALPVARQVLVGALAR